MTLRLINVVIAASILCALGCSSGVEKAQKDSYEAQGNVANERLKLIEQYQKCVKEAADDTAKSEACDSYLKAAEALK
jgi:hypothetical protein